MRCLCLALLILDPGPCHGLAAEPAKPAARLPWEDSGVVGGVAAVFLGACPELLPLAFLQQLT